MPVIKITEQESISAAAFDATENVVLVPMLWARAFEESTYTESDVPSAKLYTSASSFKKDVVNNGGKGGSGSRYIYCGSLLDKTYIMIYELLLQGLSVVVKPVKFDNISKWNNETSRTEVEETDVQKILEDAIKNGCLDEFKDRNIFNIKFVTSGAYPNCGKVLMKLDDGSSDYKASTIHIYLNTVAATRADAVALIEFRNFGDVKHSELLNELKDISVDSSYRSSAAFYPHAVFNTTNGSVEMPACFAYLMAFADSVKSNSNWFAAAGVTRGYVPNMTIPVNDVGEALMHTLQGDADDASETKLNIKINPIMNAGSYGYRIWGNRTMFAGSSANNAQYRDFLNVRLLICDIKKQIFHAAMRTTFEPNDDIVWFSFRNLTNSLLDKMKSGRGISKYTWVREVVKEKATIKANLYITPIEAVDSFVVNVVLTDEEVAVNESNESI